MKSLKELLAVCRCIIIDASTKCSVASVDIERDMRYISHRVKHEGLSFLTITLPNFGNEFEYSLTNERVASNSFSGMKKNRSLPAFLQGLTRLVFDVNTGGLLDDRCIAAVEGIRQIAYSFKKLQVPCTPEREYLALHRYREVENTFRCAMSIGDSSLFVKVCNLLWGNVFGNSVDLQNILPKHGPGQTAENIFGNRKYLSRVWYERLDPFFPLDSFLLTGSSSHIEDYLLDSDTCSLIPRQDETPVKVCLVPKTLKGPRIIAMEPVCMQYTQQALSEFLIKRIESHKLTKGHINFSDQNVNRDLALRSSSNRSYATLDLSEASDRVPLSLASCMFLTNRDLKSSIFACRSKSARMPSGEIIRLKKFASMGSALCFPIESMYFFSVVLTSRFKHSALPVNIANILKLIRDIYVYGDDIIVPTDEADMIMETLTRFHCKVNVHKSFWKGNFRESCGMDAFDGVCVTPTYIRQLPPHNQQSVHELVSWIKTRNLFYLKGYKSTSMWIKTYIEGILGALPSIQDTSPGLGWLSDDYDSSYGRWNKELHRFEVRTYCVSPVYRKDRITSWPALLKFFLSSARRSIFDLMASDKKHLERSARPGAFALKLRWTTSY